MRAGRVLRSLFAELRGLTQRHVGANPARIFRVSPFLFARMVNAIHNAHAAGIKIGICGQGPSNYPDLAEFLVQDGIDSISLLPECFLKTAQRIAQAEADLSSRV